MLPSRAKTRRPWTRWGEAAHRFAGTIVYLGSPLTLDATRNIEHIAKTGTFGAAVTQAVEQLGSHVERLKVALAPHRAIFPATPVPRSAEAETKQPSTARIRVALVDDHAGFRQALRMMLDKEPDMEVVAEAGDGEEAVRTVIPAGADVVCMDLRMPRMNGIEATRRLLALKPSLKVIGLSAMAEGDFVQDLINVGAAGYVSKDESIELPAAIRAAWSGRKERGGVPKGRSGGDLMLQRLGARERQILECLAQGHTTTEIAERLDVAVSTVEVYRRNIMRKFNVQSAADLARYAGSARIT